MSIISTPPAATHKDLPLAKENQILGLDGQKPPGRAKSLKSSPKPAGLRVAVQFNGDAVISRTATPRTPIMDPNAKGIARLNTALVTGVDKKTIQDKTIVQIGSSAVLQRRSRPSTPTTPIESNSASATAQTSSSTSSTAYKSYQPIYSIAEIDEKKENETVHV